MQNFKLIQFIAFFAIVVVFSSCKEEEPAPPTIESQLIGVWTGDEFYEDGLLSEWNDVFKLSTIEFLENGTGNSIMLFGEQTTTWSYDATTKKLTIIYDEYIPEDGSIFSISADTTVADITKIDDSNLWITSQDEGVTIEERYVK